MNRERSMLLLVALWVPLMGCFLFPSNPSNNDVPAVEDEGCSNDHAQYFAPGTPAAVVLVGGEPASSECNQITHYDGGGGQGGAVFHIEPSLLIEDPMQVPAEPSVTWEIYDLDTNNLLGSQGFEIYPESIVESPAGIEFTNMRLFISPDDRGKNLRLDAITNLLLGGDAEVESRASAAVYVSADPG